MPPGRLPQGDSGDGASRLRNDLPPLLLPSLSPAARVAVGRAILAECGAVDCAPPVTKLCHSGHILDLPPSPVSRAPPPSWKPRVGRAARSDARRPCRPCPTLLYVPVVVMQHLINRKIGKPQYHCGKNCVPKNLRKTADINGSLVDELGDQAGEIPQVGGAKVSKKRNYSFSYDPSEVFVDPRRKYQRSTIQTVIGGEITLNNRPSVLEEKCSKNEHDAAPLEYGNKGSQNPRIPVDSASSDDLDFANGKAHNSDFVDADEPSEEITVVTALS
ncbi:hypothetical protein ZWY2020_001512 [Hordeum vulgare]|nr:hypothetical protein ZWY2020_001512 [Hordeum vulgare]